MLKIFRRETECIYPFSDMHNMTTDNIYGKSIQYNWEKYGTSYAFELFSEARTILMVKNI